MHPVKESKEGQVSNAKPRSMLPRFRSILLILGTILALGVLVYVLYSFTNKPFVEDSFTAEYPLETTTTYADTPTTSEVSPTDLTTPIQTATTAEGTEPNFHNQNNNNNNNNNITHYYNIAHYYNNAFYDLNYS